MSKNVIFCYSGTGNSLDFAKNIATGLGDTDIIMIRKFPAVTDVSDAETVGFVFPCFGGGAPKDFLTHVRALKINPSAYTYGISMSASYPGIGLSDLNEIIYLKYWKTVTHQCSCIWLLPHDMMVPPMNAEAAQKRSEKIARETVAEIKDRRRAKKAPSRAAFNVVENKAWPKLSLKKASAFEVSSDCIACGQCVKLCPRENIEIFNGKAKIGTDCIQCLGCLQYCPKEAISIGTVTQKREHYHNPNISAADLMEEVIHIG